MRSSTRRYYFALGAKSKTEMSTHPPGWPPTATDPHPHPPNAYVSRFRENLARLNLGSREDRAQCPGDDCDDNPEHTPRVGDQSPKECRRHPSASQATAAGQLVYVAHPRRDFRVGQRPSKPLEPSKRDLITRVKECKGEIFRLCREERGGQTPGPRQAVRRYCGNYPARASPLRA